MLHQHRARCDRNGDIGNVRHSPHGGINLGGATGAIHAFNTVAGLDGGFWHDGSLQFSAKPYIL